MFAIEPKDVYTLVSDLRHLIVWAFLAAIMIAVIMIGFMVAMWVLHVRTARLHDKQLTAQAGINLAVMDIQAHQAQLADNVRQEIRDTLIQMKVTLPAAVTQAAEKAAEKAATVIAGEREGGK